MHHNNHSNHNNHNSHNKHNNNRNNHNNHNNHNHNNNHPNPRFLPIHKCSFGGDVRAVRKLAARGAFLNARDSKVR